MNKRTVGIAAVFLVGCAVGGVSSQLAVPKASAQQAATLTKWEHFCYRNDFDGMTAAVDKAGPEGWELVAVTNEGNWAACFKRPKM